MVPNSQQRVHFFIEFTNQGIFQASPFWMPSWGVILLLYGTLCWLLGISYLLALDGKLGMGGKYMWPPIIGCLIPRYSSMHRLRIWQFMTWWMRSPSNGIGGSFLPHLIDTPAWQYSPCLLITKTRKTDWYGRRIKLRLSRFEQRTRLLYAYSRQTALNIHWCKLRGTYGGEYGSWTCHPKSVLFYGGHAQDVYQQGRTCTRNESESRNNVNCVTTRLRQSAMCCGSVHWRGMYGLYSREASRSAATSLLISFSSFGRCSRSSVPLSWRSGQSQLGWSRNKFYIERVQLHPKVISESAIRWLEEYQRLNAAQRV